MTAGSHIQAQNPNSSGNILSLDFGGSRVKSVVLCPQGTTLSPFIVEEIPYPFAPSDMLATISNHARNHIVDIERITVGIPGIVRDGVVIHTPHYIRPAGPGGQVDVELEALWDHCQLQDAIEITTTRPALVVNDALIAAAAVIAGTGSELVLTFGTGLGVAFAVNGRLTEHIEVSHAPSPLGGTFDDIAGAINTADADADQWSAQVCAIVAALWPMYRWDRLYIGGGNALKLNAIARNMLQERAATFVDYEAGARGGARAWTYMGTR